MGQKVNIHVFHECSGEHVHDYPQILVPRQKIMRISVSGTEYEVTPQELFFVPSGMNHQCNYQGNLVAINLCEDMLETRDVILMMYPMIISMRGQITQLVDIIQTELEQNPDSKSVRYLYSYLCSKIIENCTAPSIRYISDNYDMPITVNQLAEIERYNVTYYNEWFKQHTGLSPSYYLRCIRINRAKDLLINTNFSVMEIAVMVGYSSNSTFTRAFHSIAGMTPKSYRECTCFKKSS